MLEAVPNVSEGRDLVVVERVARAFSAGARLLDVHSDADHNRSVYTLVGERPGILEALLAGSATALRSIDLRRHAGVHPRVGAVDVVPLVPLVPQGMEEAEGAARELARRLGDELAVPVFLYAESGGGRRPAFFRRGGPDELARRIASGELVPDAGPARLEPRSGAILVGAREPLVAYNVELSTDDLAAALAIASAIRESSGGLPGVQAIGLRLPRAGRVQVSTNVLDLERTPLHEVVARVAAEAAARGVRVAGGELVGLVPERVLTTARAAGVEIPGVDESRVLERRAGI